MLVREWLKPLLLGLILVLLVGPAYLLAAITPTSAAMATAAKHKPTNTPTPTPTPTRYFSVTVEVRPERAELKFAEPLTVTVMVHDESQECGYLVYDITLSERGEDAPIFEFLSPQIVGPPVLMPATFTLKATTGGKVAFFAWVYGETTCGGGWSWIPASGLSEPVTVESERSYLPVIFRHTYN
jgi:hypothetical protein